MKADHAINVLFTEHPQWRTIRRKEFSVRDRGGWSYIVFRGVEIERVRVDGQYIYEEFLGHSADPEDY